MNITKNFTLKELTKTNTGITNEPNKQELQALIALSEKVLQPLRGIYGKPITVNSGFRSYAVNKAVGGARNSQHSKGEAADITVHTKEGNKKLFDIIKNELEYDQLINEYDYRWIHVSYRAGSNRKQILKIG